MIEIHTKINCSCGKSFHAMYASNLPLSESIEQQVYCPFCGRSNRYKYRFSAVFKCAPKKWQFWKSKQHFIINHFSANEGNKQDIFPRSCVCGEELLLKQERMI